MRVFVSGASGWIGRGLVAELTAAGYNVTGLARDDAARLFRLALESAPAGSVLHAVGDEGVPIREVAEVFEADRALTRNFGRQVLLPGGTKS